MVHFTEKILESWRLIGWPQAIAIKVEIVVQRG